MEERGMNMDEHKPTYNNIVRHVVYRMPQTQ